MKCGQYRSRTDLGSMRFKDLELLAAGAMIWAGLLVSSAAQEIDGNAEVNQGFESSDSDDGGGSSAAKRSGIQAHSGEWCLRIEDNSPDEIEHLDRPPMQVSLQGGGQFYAEGWMRIDNAAVSRTGYGLASLDIAFYTADGVFLSKQTVGATTSSKWVRIGNVVTLPYEAALLGFRVTPADRVAPLRGAVFIDDLYLAPLPMAEENDRVKLTATPAPPKQAPEYLAPPRPQDGRYLAQTVAKLENGFDPPRPLVIWAIGSSFTDFLGNGEDLIADIRERFPNAPPIIYKKMVGGSTPWHLLRGWARHLVIPDQPDVVLIYNFGKTSGMEKLLEELRRKTTADILVGTLHWCRGHQPVWPDPEAVTRHLDPPALRRLCDEYAVEFVENRREITRYMVDNDLEISDLLVDSVHQSPYAARMINANIARHFHRADQASTALPVRERRIVVNSSQVVKTGEWNSEGDSKTISASGAASLAMDFTGSGINLIGFRAPDSGSARIWIDGEPASEARAFYATYVQPGAENFIDLNSSDVDYRRHISDRCPHGVSLGEGLDLVPQRWTLLMTSDEGDYSITGSVTGPDGSGNAFRPFTSDSGQITVDPELWRLAKTNRSGDKFTFEVVRNVQSQIDFSGPAEKFRTPLMHGLVKGKHTLKIEIVDGEGPVTIEVFEVIKPPR